MPIFSVAERLPVDLSAIGLPGLRNYFKDGQWGGTTYYADCAGLARKYQPKRILEMGVYRGHSAFAFLTGSPVSEYFGIDNEREIPGGCDLARSTLRLVSQRVTISKCEIRELPKMLQVWGVREFDLIYCDADHTFDGTMLQLSLAYASLAKGGLIVLDDMDCRDVGYACVRFLTEHPRIESEFYASYHGWQLIRGED